MLPRRMRVLPGSATQQLMQWLIGRCANAIMEAELTLLRDVLARERRRADEIREDRERRHS